MASLGALSDVDGHGAAGIMPVAWPNPHTQRLLIVHVCGGVLVMLRGGPADVGAENDFHAHWIPYMKHMGFEATDDVCARSVTTDNFWGNAIFVNKDVDVMPMPTEQDCYLCFHDT